MRRIAHRQQEKPRLENLISLVSIVGMLLAGAFVSAAEEPIAAGAIEIGCPADGFRAIFREDGVRIVPEGKRRWVLDLSPAGEFAPEPGTSGSFQIDAAAERVEYVLSEGVSVWYQRRPEGLFHGVTLRHSPDTQGPFALPFRIAGGLAAKDLEGTNLVELLRDGEPVLRIGEFAGVDADGNEVPAEIEVAAADLVRVVLERTEAAYPVRIEGRIAAAKGGRLGGRVGPEAVFRPATFAPPANDLCPGAEVIPPAGPFPVLSAVTDIADATSSGDPVLRPSCAFGGEPVTRSTWYTFTPAATGTYSFTACAEAPTATTVDDTVLAIFTSTGDCAGTFTEIQDGCDDDSCDLEDFQSFLSTTLEGGTRYWIVIWNLGPAPTAGNTSLQLLVTASLVPAPPPNDTCENAEVIPSGAQLPYLTAVTANVSDATATGDPPVPTCLPDGFSATRSVWYRFTPPATGIYGISTCAQDRGGTATTLNDPILSAYTSAAGCEGPFTEIATAGLSDGCDDDSCVGEPLQSLLLTRLEQGTTYYFLVHKVGSVPPTIGNTAVQLRVEALQAPGNDTCASATTLELDTPVTGSNEQAADDTHAPTTIACFSGVGQLAFSSAPGRDVAYTFAAPSTGAYSFRVTGFDSTNLRNLVVYAASDCPETAPATVTCLLAANRSTGSTAEEVRCLSIDEGETVYVYVDEDTMTAGSPFVIEANRCPLEDEPNDTPATASTPSCGVEGSILYTGGGTGDFDFFSIGAPVAGSRIFALADGVAANTTDFDLRVTTDVDTLEYDDLDADRPFGSLAPAISGTSANGTATYLRVSTYNALTSADPYRLYSVIQPPIESAADESEPNDALADADSALSGYFKGTLPGGPAASTDVDLFAFDADEGDLIFLALDGDPLRDATPINGSLALLDASGAALIAVNDGNSTSSTETGVGGLNRTTPRSPAEGLLWRVRNSGRYYAKVAIGTTVSNNPSNNGDYVLSISLNCITDADGDGVPNVDDCAPLDPAFSSLPGEVTSLAFEGTTTISWTPPPAAGPLSDLLRGAIDSLPVGPGGADEQCFPDLSGTSTSDSATPSAGAGFWYLVRAKNPCGVGGYGFRSFQGVPAEARETTTCP